MSKAKATLYELTGDYQVLWDKINRELPEDETEAAAIFAALYQEAVENLQVDIGNKMEGYAKIIKNTEARKAMFKAKAAVFEDEAKRIKAKEKAEENKIKRLKEAVMHSMQACGVDEIDTGTFAIKIQPSPKTVFIADGVKLHLDYCKPPEPDKKKLLAAIEAGEFEEDEDVYITQSCHLRIR